MNFAQLLSYWSRIQLPVPLTLHQNSTVARPDLLRPGFNFKQQWMPPRCAIASSADHLFIVLFHLYPAAAARKGERPGVGAGVSGVLGDWIWCRRAPPESFLNLVSPFGSSIIPDGPECSPSSSVTVGDGREWRFNSWCEEEAPLVRSAASTPGGGVSLP
jgi:hypothetical protein